MKWEEVVKMSGNYSSARQVAMALCNQSLSDAILLEHEGLFECFDYNLKPDKMSGYSDWVGFIPSLKRAGHVSNGNAIWFPAESLDEAVRFVQTSDEEDWAAIEDKCSGYPT